jgi:putative transposase
MRPLTTALQALKQSVARTLALRASEPFWQARYYDFNVWSEEKRVGKLRSIRRNPVKRGLVEKPEDWQWSSFRRYRTGMRGTVEIESEWTARQRGWQLPEWMRDPWPVSSTSPVPKGEGPGAPST